MLVLCEAFSKYYKTTQKFWFIETLHYNCNWFVHNQVLVTNFLKKSIDWLIFSDAHLFKVVNPLLSDILSLFSWKYQETGGFQLFFFVVFFSVGGGGGVKRKCFKKPQLIKRPSAYHTETCQLTDWFLYRGNFGV